MRGLIFTRVSEDTAGGRSPAEQETECRAWCDQQDIDVQAVIRELGSASRHGRNKRRDWERATEMLASGEFDVLVTWEASRAQRDLMVYAKLRDLCVEHNVRWAYNGRMHDLTDSDDRFRTGIDALLAERYADEISERVRRAARANARDGKPHGRVLYGYRRIYDPETGGLQRQEPHPQRAAVVRRVADDFLSGKGARTIARELNDSGIRTASGRQWNGTMILRMLRNPAYAGRRVYQGEEFGTADWDPLIDPDTWAVVQERLRATSWRRQRYTTRLLSGIARCGACGSKMEVHHSAKGSVHYGCQNGYHTFRDLEDLEDWVSAHVIRFLQQPDVADAVVEGDFVSAEMEAARRKLDQLRGELDEAMGLWKSGKLRPAAYADMEQWLLPKISEAERAVRKVRLPLRMDLPDVPDSAWWESVSAEQRREIVAALISAVVVHPVGRGCRVIDWEAATTIEWRQ